jgi:phosphotransferase system HPr (HPr) family protein
MNGEPLKQTVLIQNPEGFHLRPIKTFVELASRFQSNVKVSRDDRSVDGKSAMEMLTQMLSMPGSTLTLEVEGPDAEDCLDALVALFSAPANAIGADGTPNGKDDS